MKSYSKILLLTTVLFVMTVIPQNHWYSESIAVAGNYDDLVQQLNHLLDSQPELKGSVAGISIRSATTGDIIYDHLGDIRLRPASNLKLLTAAAALEKLGPDYHFSTEVRTDGELKQGIVTGNLYLKGKGDPTLLAEDLDQLAQNLKEQGVKEIRGDLIGDDSWYDDKRYSSDLTWSDEYTYYGGQVSALTVSPDRDYDAGTTIVKVVPAKEIGKKPKIELLPKNTYIRVVNDAVTASPDGAKKVIIEREHGANIVTISGVIPLGAKPELEWISVWEPTNYAINIFKQSLLKNGISVMGTEKRGVTPATAKLFSEKKSMPLSELLIPFMKLSNNGHAEILTKELGKFVKGEGSWESGIEVISSELGKLGMDSQSLMLRDGSGISQSNLIPANEISKLLYNIQNKNWFSVYVRSLPIAGVDGRMVGGTLRNRMKIEPLKGKVKAKTGTISTVSSLSGYIDTKSGDELIFSILLNNLLEDTKGKAIEDKILTIIGNQ